MVERPALHKTPVPPPLKLRKHHGKGDQRTLRAGRYEGGLWNARLWARHSVVVWIKMTLIGSDIWLLSHQGVELLGLEELGGVALEGAYCWGNA